MPSLVLDSEESAPRSLCFEGGTRIIAISEDPHDHLVLHSEILDEASPFFKAGAKEPWAHDAKTVKDPNTGADVNVLTYHLALNEDDMTIMLSQRAPATSLCRSVRNSKVRRFYLSDNASGFLPRSGSDSKTMLDPDGEYDEVMEYISDVRHNHREIFMLLYSEEVTGTEYSNPYNNIAEKMAYAEFYQLSDLLAPKLKKLLLGMYDVWSDIGENYMFHLALAKKLQCRETFTDAMRHYVGNGVDLSHLVSKLSLEPAFAFQIAMQRDELNQRINAFASDLHALYLPTHVYNGDPHDQKSFPEALKTMSTRFGGEVITSGSTARSIASQIFGQWLSHHQAGDKYWLQLRQHSKLDGFWSNEPVSKLLNPGSLRQACNRAVNATQCGTEVLLFDAEVIDDFVQRSDLATSGGNVYDSILEIEKELKGFVNQTANLAMPLIAPPSFEYTWYHNDSIHHDYSLDQGYNPSKDFTHESNDWDSPLPAGSTRGRDRGSGRGRGRGGRGGRARRDATVQLRAGKVHAAPMPRGNWRTARDDTEAHYFTCTDAYFGDLVPWTNVPEKSYQIKGLEPASKAWKEALGVLGSDEE